MRIQSNIYPIPVSCSLPVLWPGHLVANALEVHRDQGDAARNRVQPELQGVFHPGQDIHVQRVPRQDHQQQGEAAAVDLVQVSEPMEQFQHGARGRYREELHAEQVLGHPHLPFQPRPAAPLAAAAARRATAFSGQQQLWKRWQYRRARQLQSKQQYGRVGRNQPSHFSILAVTVAVGECRTMRSGLGLRQLHVEANSRSHPNPGASFSRSTWVGILRGATAS